MLKTLLILIQLILKIICEEISTELIDLLEVMKK